MDKSSACRRTALYSVQTAYACASIPADWYLRVEEPPRTLYRTASFRVSETGCAINERIFFSGIPVSCISFQSTCGTESLKKCSERVHPFFQEQSYCGSERRHRWLPMQAQAVCTEYNAVRRHADDLSIVGVST